MREEIIKVLKIEPGKRPIIKKIPNELKALQKAVGGNIEVIRFGTVVIIVNEEGKLMELPMNKALIHGDDNFYTDILVGTIIIAGDGGEDFRSLTDLEINDYSGIFKDFEVRL